jgi:hypothetical protein
MEGAVKRFSADVTVLIRIASCWTTPAYVDAESLLLGCLFPVFQRSYPLGVAAVGPGAVHAFNTGVCGVVPRRSW